MKKSFSLAAASVLLLASFSSCQFSDSAEDTFVSIVCSTAQASEITIDSASLNGTVQLSNAKAEQAELWFMIGQDENTLAASGEKISAGTISSKGGTVSASVSNLQAQTTYYYMLCASIDGKQAAGEVVSFTTLPKPKETIVTLTTGQASGVTCFIAKLNGSLTVESEKQLSQSVSFLYSDSARTVEGLKASGKKVPAELTEDGSFTSALSKLGSNTTYFYVACAEVSEKEYYGEVKSFKTVDLHLEAVDMGLSVKWASSNLGAAKPEDYGDYYAWGETEPKDYYDWNTYKWCDDSKLFDKLTKYNNMPDYGTVDNKTRLDLDTDDVARVLLGEKWRMPEEEDFKSLITNCTWKWTQLNGVNGYLATSNKNGASIFLPAAGYRRYGELENAGSHGYYWSATLFLDLPEYARCLDLTSDDFFVNHKNRFFGFPIRPVQIN